MKSLADIKSSFELFNVAPRIFIYIVLIAFSTGCASHLPASDEKKSEFFIRSYQLTGNPNKHKSIFIFLDGTANDPKSETNVWRLYDSLSKASDPQATGIYIEGVGNRDEQPVLGMMLGKGMEERILKGYEFITQNYNPKDDIYIFGFSRGAHEARALAGFLAYAGVPIILDENRNHLSKIGNDIIELVKDKTDEDYLDKWTSWVTHQSPPLLADEIKDKLKLEMRAAEVTFLGIWDTVPGSSFKEYGDCKENIGIVKKYFYWLPLLSKGERYKSDSYPAIHQIAHAVSLDEKRSKFAPLLICPAIKSEYTKLNEVWFPGAHADVGGGYSDSNDLAGISYNWMIDLLAKNYKFSSTPKANGSVKGLAHWSIGDSPANFGSSCEDRTPPQGAQIHASFNERREFSPMPIRIEGVIQSLPYPKNCY